MGIKRSRYRHPMSDGRRHQEAAQRSKQILLDVMLDAGGLIFRHRHFVARDALLLMEL